MPSATLTIPGTPPSLNQIGYRSHWAVGHRHKQAWEQFFHASLLLAEVPKGLKRVDASAEIRFKQRRRRDEGNYRALIEKALGDVLQRGWLEDDTPEHYRFGSVELVAPSPEALTVVSLTYE